MHCDQTLQDRAFTIVPATGPGYFFEARDGATRAEWIAALSLSAHKVPGDGAPSSPGPSGPSVPDPEADEDDEVVPPWEAPENLKDWLGEQQAALARQVLSWQNPHRSLPFTMRGTGHNNNTEVAAARGGAPELHGRGRIAVSEIE
jgi:hypothetical protein